VADLFVLKVEDLVELERFAETSAKNLVAACDHARETATFSRLLAALGIRHVGGVAARAIAQKYRSMDALLELIDKTAGKQDAFVEEIMKIEGIGEVIARSLETFLREPHVRSVLALLKKRGVDPVEPKARVATGPLSGKTFVITGTLSAPRSDIAKLISDAGGKVTGSVSGSTDYLVAGENTGETKIKAAAKHGVKVLDEAALKKLLS
jgi:DNA ligase (NAD+)